MTNRVVITGSEGTIGSVLSKGLRDRNYDVTGLDILNGEDVTNYSFLVDKFTGADAVIHLAHDVSENWASGSIVLQNIRAEMTACEAAVKAGVTRLIMASSVHADDFNSYEGAELLTVPGSLKPASPYGTHKLLMEEVGRFYAALAGLEFISVRFGGVSRDNLAKRFGKEPAVWLSHSDLIRAIDACLSAPIVPGNYAVFYAVSDNEGRVHDTSNPFGWIPLDNSGGSSVSA